MRKFKTQLLAVSAVILLVASASAQDIKLKSGALEFLKGEPTLNVAYDYAGLTVGKLTEQAYMDSKVAEFNKKEAGKGEKWLASWQADRTNRFEPKFEELLNKQFSDKKFALKAGKNPGAKYTMVLKTTNLEPGWNVAVMRTPASISTQAEFFAGDDRTKSLAVITILKAPGRDAMGYDFDVGFRLQEGYAKTGKELGAFLCKKALK